MQLLGTEGGSITKLLGFADLDLVHARQPVSAGVFLEASLFLNRVRAK